MHGPLPCELWIIPSSLPGKKPHIDMMKMGTAGRTVHGVGWGGIITLTSPHAT